MLHWETDENGILTNPAQIELARRLDDERRAILDREFALGWDGDGEPGLAAWAAYEDTPGDHEAKLRAACRVAYEQGWRDTTWDDRPLAALR